MHKVVRLSAFFLLMTLASAAVASTTLKNLQTAYNGESNARARYLAFAVKADQEGYAQAAALFRAAARAEQVHASNHAVVIQKLGAKPEAKIEPPVVKSTKENLEAAVKGETYERDVMYPGFIKQAQADNDQDALRTFDLALSAEGEHAKLYSGALADPDKMKAKGVSYQVCPVCGYTVPKADFSRCPACGTPKEQYETVS